MVDIAIARTMGHARFFVRKTRRRWDDKLMESLEQNVRRCLQAHLREDLALGICLLIADDESNRQLVGTLSVRLQGIPINLVRILNAGFEESVRQIAWFTHASHSPSLADRVRGLLRGTWARAPYTEKEYQLALERLYAEWPELPQVVIH